MSITDATMRDFRACEPNDDRLTGLIEQNTLARNVYFIRKDQENAGSRRGGDLTLYVKRTAQAERAWIHAEKELWEYRGVPQRAVARA